MEKGWTTEKMALEVIGMFSPNSTVNLGIGMPTLVAELMPQNHSMIIHSENGVLGVGGWPEEKDVSPTLINAGKQTISIVPGGSFFDSAMSFGMIRGGHVDYCVLGGMEVDVQGNLANWMIPGKKIMGMGGAMDLVHGAKCVIVMLNHFNKDGECKLLEQCRLPLTGKEVVHKIVTDYGIFLPHGEYFIIQKLAPNVSEVDLKKGADLFRWS